MKELTIEEKAKAYDEAKARMSKAYNSNRCTIGFMNEIFPEFKDEDERIKEEIINYFECQSRDEPCRKSIHDKWIAWIEKQGQTFTKEDVDDAYLAGIRDTKQELKKISQRTISAEAKEAMYGKPTAWSEEDEKAINDILWIIEAYKKNGFNETHIQVADNSEKWLKSIKQRIGG